MTSTEALQALQTAGRIRSPWLPGMLRIHRYPAEDDHPAGVITWRIARTVGEFCIGYDPDTTDEELGVDSTEPDLTDPATVGCLLALVREASGDFAAHTTFDPGSLMTGAARAWAVWVKTGSFARACFAAPTEGEALAKALVALAGGPRG